jgi:ABC-type polysaccharide/polyol phosphate transport system ATPase subunit
LQNWRRWSEDFWALRDVSFQVRRAEALGIIGPNGAGKSTILKLLSNITTPSAGEITIRGRLSALIEVGSGFHPELTGRENVYLSGSILGMRRREISQNLASIVSFAGVEEFIDTPVKRYSSGMYLRLGFSIAAHLRPDILLLDEVLAVGDAAFQAKCFSRIAELKESGVTIVFISHDLSAIALLCDRVILVDHGRITAEGRPDDVIKRYEHSAFGTGSQGKGNPEIRADGKEVKITGLKVCNQNGEGSNVFRTGHPLRADVEFTSSDYVSDITFEVFYYSANGNCHCQYTTALTGEQINLEPGTGVVQFFSAELGLKPGVYYVDATVKYGQPPIQSDWLYRGATFRVDSGKAVAGRFYMPHEWRLLRAKLSPDIDDNRTCL